MQIKIPVAVLFVLFCITACAQTLRLQITLKNPGKDTLMNATIQLFSLPDSQLLQSQVSKPVRNIFLVKPFASYLLRVSAVGYRTGQKRVHVAGRPLSVNILLSIKNDTLQAVTVLAGKPLIRQEGDKTIVDAEVLANSSTNAYEVLEKTPGAVVDQDGNVYLNSATPATIYINGVQMRLSADDIASLLKSLPAGSISKIEIIRTPSAKYDASNSGGIINIVLKKGVEIGTSGSVNIRDDQGVYNSATAGVSLNESVGKTRSYISYQYTSRHYYDDIQSDRQIYADTMLAQKSSTRFTTITNYVGGGTDVLFSKKFDVAYDLRLIATSNTSHASSSNLVRGTATADTLLQTLTPITNSGNSLFLGNTLSAKYKLDTTGSEWTAETDYNYSNNPYAQVYTINSFSPPAPAVAGNGNVHNSSKFVNLKTDLSLVLPRKFTLESGLKLSNADNHDQALYFKQTGNLPPETDSFQTNSFRYQENIGSAYLQLSKTLARWILKAGLRFEHTGITGHQLVPTDTVFSINRNDLFPYLFLQHNLFTILGYPIVGHALFRRSITRPAYDQLNPSPKFIDQFTYTVGDPNLKPQFTTNYEINATFNDFPVFALGINHTQDVFSSVTYQNDSSGIAFRTFDNLGSYKEAYGRLFGGLPTGHRYFMYVGVQYNFISYDGSYQQKPLQYSRSSWTFFMGHSFKITPTLNVNLHSWMYVNGFRAFNELKTMGQLNMSVTKTLLNKKLSIIASGSDILKTNISRFHLEQPGVLVNGTRIQDSRRFGITLRYNFGFVRTEEKKPAFSPPVEAELSN